MNRVTTDYLRALLDAINFVETAAEGPMKGPPYTVSHSVQACVTIGYCEKFDGVKPAKKLG